MTQEFQRVNRISNWVPPNISRKRSGLSQISYELSGLHTDLNLSTAVYSVLINLDEILWDYAPISQCQSYEIRSRFD